MESSKTERKPGISAALSRKRLKVFSTFARDESPPDEGHAASSIQEELQEETKKEGETPDQKTPANSRRRISKFCLKPSCTLKLGAVSQQHLVPLQKMLTQFGSIKTINSNHIDKGILLISYLNMEDAKNAFNSLLEYKMDNERVQVAYVYDEGPDQVLPSIHEFSDSSKSDPSEEGSDSEKKKAQEAAPPVLSVTAAEIKAEQKTAEEIKVTPPARSYEAALTPPRPPLGFSRPFTPLGKKELNKTVYAETPYCYSECSFEGDNVNEGIEANIPRKTMPKAFPGSMFGACYYQTPTGSAVHTESTTNIDSDEALSSSGRFDRESSFSFYSPDHLPHSRKSSNMSQAMYQSPNAAFDYTSNPELMWTQPVRQLKPAPAHTHTKSYDVAAISQGFTPPYMYPQPYDSHVPPPGYYPYVDPGEYPWEDPVNYSYYVAPQYYSQDPGSVGRCGKGVRKKNPEPETNKAMFAINLEDIMGKKDKRTTIMIKNIPNKYNQKMLLRKIDEHHKHLYDFFYLPIDFKNKCNVGYAFINFVSPLYILPFYEEFNARKWEKFNSEKICQLTYARIQGKQALMCHFQSSSTMCQQDKKVRPLILTVQMASATEMAEYERKLTLKMTHDKIQELARVNATIFCPK